MLAEVIVLGFLAECFAVKALVLVWDLIDNNRRTEE